MSIKDRGVEIVSYTNRFDLQTNSSPLATFLTCVGYSFGDWIMSGYELSEPVKKQNIVNIPRYGYVADTQSMKLMDVSTAFTDGVTKFENRQLKITLECSNGTHEDREGYISEIERLFLGQPCKISSPDSDGTADLVSWLSVYGRMVSIEKEYNDLYHAKIILNFDVDPYRKIISTKRVSSSTTATIRNDGMKSSFAFLYADYVTEPFNVNVIVGSTQKVYKCYHNRSVKLYDFPINSGESKIFRTSEVARIGFETEVL